MTEVFALEHLYEFIFQRDRCGLLIVGTGSDAHGQRDTIGIHKKSHLDQRQAGQIYLWILTICGMFISGYLSVSIFAFCYDYYISFYQKDKVQTDYIQLHLV